MLAPTTTLATLPLLALVPAPQERDSLLVPFAVLTSALLLAMSSYARSYREAQTYLLPLTLLVLVPVGMAAAPQIELSSLVAVVPIANVRKPKGAKRGLVTVHGGKTVHLRRVPKRLERVLAARIEEEPG